MPNRVSASRQRYQKRRRMCRSRHLKSDEQRILREIEQRVAAYEQKKSLAIRTKELAVLEAKFQKNMKDCRDREKHNLVLANKWTGLRIQPDEEVEGRNWMTCFCLRRKRSSFPPDVMFLINQFLNWVPAGCWIANPNHGCSECRICFTDSTRYGAKVCSWQCYEVNLRNRILSDYDLSVNIISQLEPGQLEYENSIDSIIIRMNYQTQYNGFLYRNELDVMEWYIMLESRDDINESIDMYGLYDDDYDFAYSDRSSCSDTDIDFAMDMMELEYNLSNVRMGISLADNEDDIWQTYRPHWTEWHTHVFYNKH